MKVKDLINELLKHDQQKEVFIQQGEEYDYMKVYSIKEKQLNNLDSIDEDEIINAVVIKYQ